MTANRKEETTIHKRKNKLKEKNTGVNNLSVVTFLHTEDLPSQTWGLLALHARSKDSNLLKQRELTSVILQRALMAGPRYTSSFPVMSLVRLKDKLISVSLIKMFSP